MSFLSHLINLKELRLQFDSFVGSLEPLKGLSKLKYLNISHNNLDRGLEYLPNNLEEFLCRSNKFTDTLSFINGLNKEKLRILSVCDNGLSGDLVPLKSFVNLEKLHL